MALNLYAGQPGAGKSYSVVAKVIIPALKKGRHVVTNIPLEVDLLIMVFGGQITQLDEADLVDPDLPEKIPNGCVAVIDECWERWPSGQRVSKAPAGDLHWLKKHRHRVDAQGNAMQVVLCTQNQADLAKWVRDLIRHTFYMNKLEDAGLENWFSISIYKGCPVGENIPERYLIRVARDQYDEDVYQYYQSATQSESNTVGDEVALDKRTVIWRSPAFLFKTFGGPVVFLCSIGVLFWCIGQYTGSDEAKAEEVAHVESAPVAQEEPEKPLALVNPPPPDLLPAAPAAAAPAPSAEAVTVHTETIQGLPPSTAWRFAGTAMRSEQGRDPLDQSNWASITGYGDLPDTTRVKDVKPMAILSSANGVRWIPLSECTPYPDGVNYSCDVDGERVTPWSGQLGLTQSAPGTAAAGARSVSTERSEMETSAAPTRSAELPRQSVTVVEDTSRMPRTLLGSNQQ